MKRTVWGVLFALVLGLSLSLILALPVAANGCETWYVATTGSDDTGDGSAGNPWATIGYALSQATSCDTIYVAAGTYYENINLVDGVQVLGAGAGVSYINGIGGTAVTADGVGATTVLSGFSIYGGESYNGGGMQNINGSLAVVSNCEFYSNLADGGGGGGMFNNESSPTVTNCTFHDNVATQYGGGMYNYGGSPTVTGCTFYLNTSSDWGGGMCNNSSSPTVTNCTFTNNTATNEGGGTRNNYGSPKFINCTLYDNTADEGGGMFSYYSTPTVTNCTFYDNTATTSGGGMFNDHSNSTVTNCILWMNSGDEIYNDNSTPTVTYCDVQGGYGDPFTTHNINADPSFAGAGTGDFHLSGGPCIDVGDNDAPELPALDFEWQPRIWNDIVDMGVDEVVPEPTEVWVDASWTCQADVDLFDPALFWQYNAFATIQEGIDAVTGSTVNVAAGTYYENIVLEDGVQVVGAGDDVTTIDGGGSGPVVTAIDVGDTTALSGFTITNGSATNGAGMYNHNSLAEVSDCTFVSNSATNNGGGMHNWSSSLTVTNCTFTGNTASQDGGGMYNTSSSPILNGCNFTGNTATEHGGGMYNILNSSPELTNCTFSTNEAEDGGGMYDSNNCTPILDTCTFTGNMATQDGGGMHNNYQCSPQLTDCAFNNNTATQNGGGMYNNYQCSPTLDTCTFTGNSADISGGGMFNYYYCSPQLTGCTFTSNTATDDGGGMYNGDNCTPTLDTCDFTGNTADDDGGGMYNYYSDPTLTDCDFESNTATQGGGMCNTISSPILNGCDFLGNNANDGGGMFNASDSDPTVTGCTFTGNTADYSGGGMYNYLSSPILQTCTFTSNTADIYGGGMYNTNDSAPMLNGCDFTTNTATIDGGGMYNENSSPTVTNCTFTGNTADTCGGGVYNYDSLPQLTNCTFHGNTATHCGGGMANNNSSPTLTNCTFYDNEATNYGGGMSNATDSDPIVTNCILWDGGDEIYNFDGNSVPVVTYCDVQGGYGVPADNNINADPEFFDPATGDLHLLGGSPCIDVGYNDAVPPGLTTDIDGEPRVMNGVVDMGVDECLAQVWVDNDWVGTTPGDPVPVYGYIFGTEAFDNIGDGIDAVVPGGTVNVYPGLSPYDEPPIVISKSLTLVSVSGDWHDTIIDDSIDSEIVIRDITSPFSGEVTISGFTISGGYYGIYIEGTLVGSSITVSNCLIYGNGSGIFGDGILEGALFIDDCIIGENGTATGIHLADIHGTVEITDSVIGAYYDTETEPATSYSGNAGNGIRLDNIYEGGTVLIDNCRISGNSNDGISDFIWGCYGQLTITNNVIGAYDYDLADPEAGEVSGNDENGIFIDHVGTNGVVTIEGNRIAENEDGIHFAGTIDGEVIINNNYIGAWTQSDGVNYHQYTGNDERGVSVMNVSTSGTLIIINNMIAENSYGGAKTGVALPLKGGIVIATISGDTIISANHIGWWIQDVAGVGPITYSGNDAPGIIVQNVVASGSLLIIGNTVTGNLAPATGIHIDSADDGAVVDVHLNNILVNAGDGLYYQYQGAGYLDEIDAENNWWGGDDASGPTHAGNPGGTGEGVSDNVDYTPWLGVSVENALAGTLSDSGLDATAANNIQVIVDGSATVTTAQYSGDPGTGGFGGATGQYIDVHVDDPTAVTELEIRLYYTDADIVGLVEASLNLSWFDGDEWIVCSNTGVNTDDIPPYSGYIWALIRADTEPTLAQLSGSIFGGGGTLLPPPIGTGDTTGPVISDVATDCYEEVTETTADICWITDEPGTSQVEFEASPSMLSPIDTNLVTVHHVQLTDLTPGTTYHYRTMSRDAYFNLTISEWYTFTTLGGTIPAAAFTSSDLTVSPAEVSIGETVTVSVLVTNTGDLAGSYQVALEINGVVAETIEVTLDAGASQSVSFSLSPEEAGSYSVLVDGLSGSFTVTAPDTSQPTSPATTEEDSAGNIWPIVGGVIAAVVVIGLVVFWLRRRFA